MIFRFVFLLRNSTETSFETWNDSIDESYRDHTRLMILSVSTNILGNITYHETILMFENQEIRLLQ